MSRAVDPAYFQLVVDSLLEKIRAKQARVGVIGLGYVGLPLIVEFAKAGLSTVCLLYTSDAADE